MTAIIGIRREDKNKWEARTPIVPDHIDQFMERDIRVLVQESPIRAFDDGEYKTAGAEIVSDLSEPPVIFGVKEIPKQLFEQGKTYVFFSHVIKGQKYNMPMLSRMMELGCNLIDYEKITDDKGRRLVFFGRYAGLAGMIDSLWSLGQRLRYLGHSCPLCEIRQTIEYDGLDAAKSHISLIGEELESVAPVEGIGPVIIGFAGYGNVSKGAQEILELLNVTELSPQELLDEFDTLDPGKIYKVVFKEEHMATRKDGGAFILDEYYNHPEEFEGIFEQYLPYLTMLVNCIYWDEKYPRLITKKYLEEHFDDDFRLLVVGDISIDIEGAIEFSMKATRPDCPSYVYQPQTGEVVNGVEGHGIVVMGVDNLPCELPKESSLEFSKALLPFVSAIAHADFSVDSFEELDLPEEIKRATILFHGSLTQEYTYIDRYL